MATFNASQNGNWSDPATWGGAGVPGVGDAVVIDNGYTVDLDQDVEIGADGNTFVAINIINGKLKFPRNASRVLTFEGYLYIATAGHLDMGDDGDPILDGYTATLNFKRTSLTNNTTVRIQNSTQGKWTCNAERGQNRYYTTVAEDITAGENTAVLTDEIDILPGDEMYFIATEDFGEGEKMNVQSWNAATKTVTLTGNFAHDHTATENTYCVVLTRPIVINKKSHTYGGNISMFVVYGQCFWRNVEIKGLSDTYGANGDQYVYTKYAFCDYSDRGWKLDLCCFNATDKPGGFTGNSSRRTVYYKTGGEITNYQQSKSANYYNEYLIFIATIWRCNFWDISIGFFLSADFHSGAYGYISPSTNAPCRLRLTRAYIKRFVNSGDNCLYSTQMHIDGSKILAAEIGYPLNCYAGILQWETSTQPGTIQNLNWKRYSDSYKWLTGGTALENVLIIQNYQDNGIPQNDFVRSLYFTIELDTSVKKEGTNSLKFIVSSAVDNVNARQLYSFVPVSAGKLVTVSGFWRHNGDFVNRPILRLIESGFSVSADMPAAADEWHPFVLSGVADFDGFAKLQLVWFGDTTGAEFWIDNITVNATRIDLGGLNAFGDTIFPAAIVKTELDAADILRQSIASYNDSGTVGEALNELALLRKLSKNKREIDTGNNQIVFYDDDGTTELLRINIYNAAGDPAYKNITKWVPV